MMSAWGAWGSTGAHRGGSGLVSGRSGGGRGALSLSRTALSAHSRRVSSLSDSVGYSLSAQHSRQGIRGHARHGHCARAAAPPPARSTPHPAPHTARPRSRRLNPPTPQLVPPGRPRTAPSHVTNDTRTEGSQVFISRTHTQKHYTMTKRIPLTGRGCKIYRDGQEYIE